MFLPPKMVRVHALGSRDVLPQVIEELYALRALHIVDFKEDEFYKRGDALEHASEASEDLIKIRSLIDGLGVEGLSAGTTSRADIESGLDTELPEVEESLSELINRRDDLQSEIEEKREVAEEVSAFKALPLNFEDYSGYSRIEVFAGYTSSEPDLSDLRRSEPYVASVGDRYLVAIFTAEDEAPDAKDRLSDAGFQAIDIPVEEGDPEAVEKRLIHELDEVESRLSRTEAEIADAKDRYGAYLLAVEEYLSIETEKKEFPLRVAESENTFVIDGWIPETQVDTVQEHLETVDDRIHFEVIEIAESGGEGHGHSEGEEEAVKEKPPVAYENPGFAAPFETFTEMFGRPKYREIDPTVMIFIAFPIIYGMMLGDVGYGLGSLLLGGFLLKKFEGAAKNLGYSLVLAGASATIFGVAYAEILGPVALGTEWAHFFNELFGFHALPLLERNLFAEHVQIPTLVMLSIWVGLVQVGGGFLLDTYNGIVSGHSVTHAIMHSFSWFTLIVGILGMVVSTYDILLMPALPAAALYPALGLTLISVAMIVASEGAIGLMEIPSRIFSHTFSFTRIAAIGLSSVGIALVINMFAEIFIYEMGGIYVAVGILVYIFGHLANLVLGVFASTLHSIRLQWVEFFTKFYEGGGGKFHPFGRITKYLEEL